MRKLIASFAAVAAIALASSPVQAAGQAEPPIEVSWPHNGAFGTFDRASVQRGYQVFNTVCAACHSLRYLSFRNLADVGYSEDQVKALAAQHTVVDGPNDKGEMFERPGRPSDRKPSPYKNEMEARAANGGAYPPDLSLITKARGGGEDYVYSVLVGYEDPPADVTVPPGMYYNKYFPGHMIAMPPILQPDAVTYADGTKATPAQMAQDVVQFLHWVAEPKLEERKQTGIKAMIFLFILTGLLYVYKRRVWAAVH